jgi:hypothetical protein
MTKLTIARERWGFKMVFEKFISHGRSVSPKATIQKGGQIRLNEAAVDKFDAENYGFAVLFFDKDTRKIGIKLAKETEPGAVKVKHGRAGATISARKFLLWYGIEHHKTTNYDINLDTKSGFYTIQL